MVGGVFTSTCVDNKPENEDPDGDLLAARLAPHQSGPVRRLRARQEAKWSKGSRTDSMPIWGDDKKRPDPVIIFSTAGTVNTER